MSSPAAPITATPVTATAIAGPREPCPCGSGRRYKACHGRPGRAPALTTRPFAGRVDETEWVALREIVPAATAPLHLTGEAARLAAEAGDPPVTLATVLPMAWPALRRPDGGVWLALQVPGRSADVARDLGAALLAALRADPGTPLTGPFELADAPRIHDLLDPAALEVTVRDGFDFWVEGAEDPTGEVAAAMERANAGVVETVRVGGDVPGSPYWCRMKQRSHLRWVLPYDEDEALDALARLVVGAGLGLGEGSRYVGSFRAHGLLAPVWDLPREPAADAVEGPLAELADRLAEELAGPRPLSEPERRARSGLVGRQLTLR